MFTVVFLVKESGAKVTRNFDSLYKCRNFCYKIMHSKKCTLVSYPNAIYE